MKILELEIESLDRCVQAKTAPLKLAETRLENRTVRPHAELCRDEPQQSLIEEVTTLKKNIRILSQKLETLK